MANDAYEPTTPSNLGCKGEGCGQVKKSKKFHATAKAGQKFAQEHGVGYAADNDETDEDIHSGPLSNGCADQDEIHAGEDAECDCDDKANCACATTDNAWVEQLLANANPEGCNQHTGPGCSGGGSSERTMETYLNDIVTTTEKKTDWSKLPADFKTDKIKAVKKELASYFKGAGNNAIKARGMLSKADDWDGIRAAIHHLETADFRKHLPRSDKPTENQGQHGNPQSKNTGKFKPYGAGTGKGEVHEAAQDGYWDHCERDEGGKCMTDDAFVDALLTGNAEPSLPDLVGDYQTSDQYVRQLTCNQASNQGAAAGSPVTNREEPDMALKEGQRSELITWITVNCDCWKGKGDAETLNEFTDDKLVEIARDGEAKRQATLALNAATRPFKLGRATLTWDADEQRFTANAALAPVQEDDEETEALYEAEGTPAPEAPVTPMTPKKKKGPPMMQPAMNQIRKASSAAEWYAMAPDEVGGPAIEAVINRYKMADKRDREQLIANLSAHLEGEPRNRLRGRLSLMDLDDLRTMQLTRVGPALNQQFQGDPAPRWDGAGGPPIYNVHTPDDEEIVRPPSAIAAAVAWNQQQHKEKYREPVKANVA